MDTIIAMAVFAFLFPISLVMFVFKDAEHVPEFIKKLANTVGKDQIKAVSQIGKSHAVLEEASESEIQRLIRAV